MAHLTNYNYFKLCKKLDINLNIVMEVFLEYIYDDIEIFFVFNKFELKFLFNYRNILRDENEFSQKFFNEIPESEDTQTFVFEKGGKTKYHLSSKCSLIKKDFLDFHIPPEIQNLGTEIIEEYRLWFKENYFGERYIRNEIMASQIVFQYNSHFPSKYNVSILNENYKLVEIIKNSSDTVIDDEFDFEKFSYEMAHLKKIYSNTFSGKTLKILSKFDYLLAKDDLEIMDKLSVIFSNEFVENYGIENVKEKFAIAKKIKFEIMKNLIDYFKWTFGLKDKDFNVVVLEKFGLECCNFCRREIKLDSVANKP